MRIHRFFFKLISLLYFLVPAQAMAMDFELVLEPGPSINGHVFPDRKVIYASGPIEKGDAEKLIQALRQAGRDEYGNKRIYLNSNGGNVGEALKMVEYMDLFEVTALVRNGDVCASACASILFISARVHFLEERAVLGFHSCKVGGHPASICNEAIANNAKYHGTAFGAVESFLGARTADDKESHDDLIYLDRDIACSFGLCGLPTYDPVLAIPSFDCNQSKKEAEKLICSDLQLARYDASLNKIYKAVLDTVNEKEASQIKASQRACLSDRNTCQNQWECIFSNYITRRHQLRSFYVIELIQRAFEQSPDSNENKKTIQALVSMLIEEAECEDINACDRPVLYDHTYEFFTYNMALGMARTSQNPEGQELENRGTFDCLVEALCDPTIKTENIFKHITDQ